MGLAGFPYDIYELHDLAKPDFPGDQYKLIVFLNCAMITETAAAGIARWQNGNRVLCWTYAAGITDYDGIRPDRHAALIGMRLGWRNQRQNIHVCVEDTGHPLTQGGAALNFGTEGSVGPVCFADDAQATVLGRGRGGVCAARATTWFTQIAPCFACTPPRRDRNASTCPPPPDSRTCYPASKAR
ncbi:MAG: hypothetical protein O2901_09230 [Verrucomicrobia bacterium]|nr:hypothetical protein [Verrucomicrobiota bacterium]